MQTRTTKIVYYFAAANVDMCYTFLLSTTSLNAQVSEEIWYSIPRISLDYFPKKFFTV